MYRKQLQSGRIALIATLLGVSGLAGTLAGCGSGSGTRLTANAARFRFVQTNMIADTAAAGATHTDPNLVNPWGISFSATGPFWVSNNHSGTSTIYDSTGTPSTLVVTIPGATASATGSPTGQVANSTTSFSLGSAPASFIFSSEDGILTAWNGSKGTKAVLVANRSSVGAVYKGLAMASTGGQNFLYAPDFHNNRIDRFDRNFQLVGSFTDPTVPTGFAPFNVQNLGGNLYVTFAKQLAPDAEDDEPGAGNGYVDVFSPDGTLLKRLISRGALNSPWGVAIAPANFGAYGGALLVGNFGDGRINAYDVTTGEFLGQMLDTSGVPILIPGLWALQFGNGGRGGSPSTLYFTAGPEGETHGLFGALNPQP